MAPLPYRIGFLVLHDCTLIALSSAVEPLRAANQLSGQALYSWHLVAADAAPVPTSDGIDVVPHATLDDAPPFDLVVVVAGMNVADNVSGRELHWLKLQARRGADLGALCSGAWVLARAGLLDGHACSAHWEVLPALELDFPAVAVNDQLWTVDRGRLTCTGGDVPMHMVLDLIRQQHGDMLVAHIQELFVCERVRAADEAQRRAAPAELGWHAKLDEAVQLMAANIEEPITVAEIARLVGASRRQLERQFLAHLGASPSRHYLALRLARARELLLHTARPIVEIAGLCGFASATHFSRCYHRHMGHPPRAERSRAPQPASSACA